MELVHADRKSNLQFQVLGPDTLALDVPASVIGPIEIVYQRQPANPQGMADNPLLRLEGDWKFNESLSKSMWEKQIPAASLEKYSVDAVAHADITNMQINLFIDVQSPNQSHIGGFLVRMNDLQAIKDNTGKLLSTDARRERIEMLSVPVKANEFNNKRDDPKFLWRKCREYFDGLSAAHTAKCGVVAGSSRYGARPEIPVQFSRYQISVIC